jgi:fibronectin type 3 domain-containing protein
VERGSVAATYNIWRGTRSNQEEIYLVGTTSDLVYSDIGVTNDTTYYYKVAGANANGQGTFSNEASDTPGTTFPAVPKLSVTAFDSAAQLNWNFTGSAATFNDYRGTAPGEEELIQSGLGGFSTSFFNSGLTNLTTYYYYITSVNGVESAPSNEVSVTPGITSLTAPLLAAVSGNNQVTISWNSVLLASSYNIWRGSRSGQEEVYLVGATTGTSFTDTAVGNNTTYYYKVAGVNDSGQGVLSNTASATPGLLGPMTPLLAVTQFSGAANLNWNYIGSATTFNIYRGTSPGTETLFFAGLGAGSTTFFNSGLTNGTTYYYLVTAVNADSESPPSSEASATPGTATLAAPLLSVVPGVNQLALSWTSIPLATSYTINRSDRLGQETLYRTAITGTTFTDTNVISGQTYFYTVKAVNTTGQGDASNEASGTP